MRREKPPFIESVKLRNLDDFFGVCVECRYRSGLYSDKLYDDLGIHCPTRIQSAAVSRRSSFLAGRLAARIGMRALGVPEEDIGIGPRGEPLWPPGVSGSMSHTAQAAVGILALGQHRVGVDVENLLSPAHASEIQRLIMSPAEQTYLAGFNDQQHLLTTIVFSAKECLYKALYPEVRSYFDFLDAEVVQVDCGRLTLGLRKSLTKSLPTATMIVIHWQVGREVMTYTPVPSSPQEPFG